MNDYSLQMSLFNSMNVTGDLDRGALGGMSLIFSVFAEWATKTLLKILQAVAMALGFASIIIYVLVVGGAL